MFLFGMFLIPNAHTNITEIDIDFQVGKCNVDTAYSDNARQLANLEKTIQYVNSHPNVRIERLTISGYASPEGPAVKNKQLGETRANALEQYIRSRIDIADSLVVRLPATIPWDMLKAEIRTSQEPGYNEIDRVLHSDSTVIEYLPGRWADRRAFEIQRQKAYKTLNEPQRVSIDAEREGTDYDNRICTRWRNRIADGRLRPVGNQHTGG